MTTGFDPIDVLGLTRPNRIVMSPMTRSRARDGLVSELTAEYYTQRAGAGLIITEGTQPSVLGRGYPSTPGLHSDEQVAAWRKVTDAVHAAGGAIVAQLMHCGRIGHPVLLPDGQTPVAPSAVCAAGQVFTAAGMKDFVTPRELTAPEIDETIADFAAAARGAIDAGFDGVEIHGANGYLVHQFLSPTTNRRTDAWGGDVAGRIRFGVAVASAVAAAIGATRTGIRLSPGSRINDMHEPEPRETYEAMVDELAKLELGYLHIVELDDRALVRDLRDRFGGTVILNPFTGAAPTGLPALALIEDGTADMVSFGRSFLANPDLPERLRLGGPFNAADPATFYGGDATGYTDYPALAQA